MGSFENSQCGMPELQQISRQVDGLPLMQLQHCVLRLGSNESNENDIALWTVNVAHDAKDFDIHDSGFTLGTRLKQRRACRCNLIY